MQTNSETGFMRLPDVLRVIPVSKTVWYEGIKAGRYPKPVKISPRCVAWRRSDISNLESRIASELSKNEQPIA